MARVSPGEQPSRRNDDDNETSFHPRHHVPNTNHFSDLHVSEAQKKLLVSFERYIINDSEVEGPVNVAGEKDHRDTEFLPRHRVPKPYQYEQSSNPTPQQPATASVKPDSKLPPTNKKSKSAVNRRTVLFRKKDNDSDEDDEAVLKFDKVSILIILAYCFAIASLALGCWYFQQDSRWNEIVSGNTYLPDLREEGFLSHKLLHFNDHSAELKAAKEYMYHTHRWLELIHVCYLGSFLVFALIQFALYVTRGPEDHSKVIVLFYSTYGIFGIFIAIFPLISSNLQQSDYLVAAENLQKFAKMQFELPREKWANGITNATAEDAKIIEKILRFCGNVSSEGITLRLDDRHVPILGYEYKIGDFYEMGFCTHHKFKTTSTILSIIFASLCVIIPCVYCLDTTRPDDTDEKKEDEEAKKASKTNIPRDVPKHERDKAPVPAHVPKHEYHHYKHTEARHYKAADGSKLTPIEMEHIKNFKDYIFAEDI